MSTKSSPRAPQRSRAASPNRRERTSDLRAAGASAAPTFKPIHTRRTFEEICERIREQLALGVLKPGDEVVVTDTLPLPPEKRFPGLTILPIAPLLARAIKEVFEDGSVTSMFDEAK